MQTIIGRIAQSRSIAESRVYLHRLIQQGYSLFQILQKKKTGKRSGKHGPTKADNQAQTVYPAERWARSRIFGEQFNSKLRQHVADALNEAGYEAIAPMLSPEWGGRTSDRYGYASTWSERHAAYACGLGTFGLSDGLITPLGKAMRVGSVVARIRIEPSPRPYDNHQAYCLFHAKGICGKCMQRCPAGAITAAGHDKVRCKAYIRQETMPFVKNRYGFEGKGCGLCQTGVPCASRIPSPGDR